MKNTLKSKECLVKAIEMHTQNPRVFYNYGLMLENDNRIDEAVSIFMKGLGLSPQDGDLNYALCVLYMQRNQFGNARQYGQVLKRYYPNSSVYAGVLQALGM